MTISSLSQLQALKRTELQALCKENSLKANSKTEELIKSLAQHYNLINDVNGNKNPAPSNSKSTTTTAKKVTAKSKAKAKAVESQQAESSNAAFTGQSGGATTSEASGVTRLDPYTQHIIDSLVIQVTDLKSKFVLSQEKIAGLERLPLKLKEVEGALLVQQTATTRLVAQNIATTIPEFERLHKQIKEGQQDRARLSNEVDELKERIAQLEEQQIRSIQEQSREEPAEMIQQAEEEEVDTPPVVQEVAVRFASPALSDAPPTRSLVGFESPLAGTPSPQHQSTPHPSSFVPTASHKGTPFRAVSALPPHMTASASSRRSPRSPRASIVPVVQPESPAAPLPNAALGKRARESDASNLSIGLETILSPPPARNRETTASSISTFYDAPTSTKKEDGHSRKKIRMSVRGDDEATFEKDNTEEDADQEEEEEDEFDPEIENSNDSVRDYLMPTKTGESPSTTLRPAAVPTSDPAYFSAPVSPSHSTPGRRASRVNENDRPTPRKSLPVSNLPFPLISPFANSSKGRASMSSSFGTPATTRLGNVSNQQPFSTLLKNTSKSASKASTINRRQPLPPRTPPASRTLFGTERFAFSDGFDAESKFEDDFETAEEDNTEIEHNWSRFGGGAFSRV
ncbi:uncharacterized protein JCM6883_004936 [Sporobolomyces salmoneus]|uniref:uncharacterized protein n=1 Tax=Sporobolomyces salmoneus TaxID=183962 RepID=UPI003171F8B6